MRDDVARRTLLLVEDEAPVARALVRMVVAAGLEVVHVTTGDAAMAQLQTRTFDVVMSDLCLPGMTGIEVLTAAREIDAALPLILMSGSPTVASARAAEALGVIAYLAKPMNRAELGYALLQARPTMPVHYAARDEAPSSCTFAE